MTNIFDKTTSACESFHSKFNSLFDPHYPDIYIFLEVLKKNQTDNQILIKTSTKKARKKKGEINNKIAFIKENINKFKNNQILKIEFLKIMTF